MSILSKRVGGRVRRYYPPLDGAMPRGASPVEAVLITLLCLGFVFGVVWPFVAEVLFVPSASMAPTLEAGDRVLAEKLAYRFSEPRRGDAVVFESANELNIKRVAALAGDRVEIRDGVLRVNGEFRPEPYVDRRLNDGDFFGPVEVPPGHVFVLGDNRQNSLDSRSLGPISKDDLIGEARLSLWPPDLLSARGSR